ncbi:DUF2924 domain-containing protein [Chitinibacter sp. GC72]|uniref:DUF2924 domain-containing protein n=1 Tax=Chitinibacter sp. GC72 TaxID=1526917 RepID=UPI0012F93D74|nr:DUF2924 domain-containing protein [Chitinibacter sp. GC72]
MNPQPELPASVLEQVSQLPDLPMPEIRRLWLKLFAFDAPTHNRVFLERRIAYQLQENAYKEIDPELLERNRKAIAALIQYGCKPARARIQLTPGTVFNREYGGRNHQVVVLPDQLLMYEGQVYNSLTQLAEMITGTQCSGPFFFGLKSKRSKSDKRRKT